MSCEGLSQEFFYKLQSSTEPVIEISMLVHQGTSNCELRTVSFPHFLVCTFSSAIRDAFDSHGNRLLWENIKGTQKGSASTWLSLEKFHKWIHTGTVAESGYGWGSNFFDLWAFGALLDAPRFQNACLRALCAALRNGREIIDDEVEGVVCASAGVLRIEDVNWLEHDLNVLVSFCIDVVAYDWNTLAWRNLVKSGGNLAVILAERSITLDRRQAFGELNRARAFVMAPYDIDNFPSYVLDEHLPEDFVIKHSGEEEDRGNRYSVWQLRPARVAVTASPATMAALSSP